MAFLEVDCVSKRFGAVQALDSVSFYAERGDVIAILGENGAGKTTLANVLFGLYQADGGDVRLDGITLNAKRPSEALDAGIGMIHQHFNLVGNMSAFENIILGLSKVEIGPEPRERVTEIAEKYGFSVNLDDETGTMPVGMQQRVEILKVLYRDVSVLILDEPTSVLAPSEIAGFLAGIRALREAGKLIFFVTHKLDEVMQATDRVIVMRHGQLVAEHQTKDSTPTMLSNEMIGREMVAQRLDRSSAAGNVVLEVKNVHAVDSRGAAMLKDISLHLRSGEVLGIAGVDGNGQRELSEVIAGLISKTSGSITLDGAEISQTSPKARYDAGIGFVPEDRHATGLVLSLSVAENLVLRSIDQAPATKKGRLDRKAISALGAQTAEEFDIRPRNSELLASALSGGNQQKIILAREIAAAKRVLIVVQPTKGLDVGAIAFVQSQIVAVADRGIGVLYISTELEHILEVADRIAVISGGEITGELLPEEVTSERISLLMAGQKEAAV